jgi:hypothetical protein
MLHYNANIAAKNQFRSSAQISVQQVTSKFENSHITSNTRESHNLRSDLRSYTRRQSNTSYTDPHSFAVHPVFPRLSIAKQTLARLWMSGDNSECLAHVMLKVCRLLLRRS